MSETKGPSKRKIKAGKFKPLPPPKTVWKCKRCGRQYLTPIIRCPACGCTKLERNSVAPPKNG